MKPLLIVLFMAITNVAWAGPGEEARHTAGVIEGCRLVAHDKLPQTRIAAMQWGICLGTVQSFQIASGHLQPNMRSCIPSEVPVQQAANVFLQFAENHPERHHDGIEVLAIEAFKAAWPCQGN
ncbi:MAG: hypothetical protein KIT48_12120 [Pseudolabrys sp.]|nr:hypothetical protein [Pseudolabrys sp.]